MAQQACAIIARATIMPWGRFILDRCGPPAIACIKRSSSDGYSLYSARGEGIRAGLEVSKRSVLRVPLSMSHPTRPVRRSKIGLRTLYSDECPDPRQIRLRKAEFLRRFKNDGFYLVDAFDDPVPKRSLAEEERQFRAAVHLLIGRLRQLVSPHTPSF